MNISSNNTVLSRKERDKLRNKEAILKAAVHLFAQKGFAETKLEDVAALAEFGKGTLYNYFENKDDLLLSAFDYAVGNMLDFLYDQLSSVSDPLDRIRLIANSQFNYYRNNTDFMHVIMTNHQVLMNHARSKEVFDRFQDLKRLVIIEMQAAIDADQLRAGNAQHYAAYLSGMIHSQVRSLNVGDMQMDEVIADEIIDVFLNGAKS
ncbi:MAG: TetR/AcrR family transcriptional regulator [Candidatus Marinimicrobia bacterium]|jgi:TetR/AcrR family transcriptional regulator, repressor of fatR-cypB operon|nr:TetR/AcrR family transcriptional regulator [Candidatus Neomarinimicrobiota bacterium]MBT4360872.1 TetR/AcrR family transcriptional regulator [Candidatus Neomarinimicrobiota bacterium]MBT4715334.1 TetR/AcrR family transcriptional regulator [Candidatus Neomarinimicrobiota bacterium]MBT4946996.1 TetR/AcrR family transcriptional regulator [Candidatus Neomarinimicrobiota bacterium]MBT5268375.1 TetR/AcrR family transcriptional regulator [Candidatus Neomarinimicrobiota bacterium]